MLNKGGKFCIFVLLIFISGFFYTQIALTDVPDVIISEIYWMGDSESSSHEGLVELKLPYSRREIHSAFREVDKDDYAKEYKNALLKNLMMKAEEKTVFV